MSEHQKIVMECAETVLKTSKQLRPINETLSDMALFLSDKILKLIESRDAEIQIPKDIQPEIQQLVNRIKGDCKCQTCEYQKKK